MKIDVSICQFNPDGGPAKIAAMLDDVARVAEETGINAIWVMDHLFQLPRLGDVGGSMMEAYATLSYLAARTSRVRLGTMVTAVTFRHPGMLVKQATALDVLSGGRANFGVGAAWYEREHLGLDLPFPTLTERFERLEETVQIAKQMWSDENGPFEGAHYRLAETVNGPQCLSRPHPPIVVGGSGEKKTLRLVARYADACNVGPGDAAEIKHKLDVLRQHCANEGRDYADIEKTVGYMPSRAPSTPPLPTAKGAAVDAMVEQLTAYADVGVDAITCSLTSDFVRITKILGEEVAPRVAAL